MSATSLLLASVADQTPRFHQEKPHVRSVVPVVRYATLLRHEPRLTDDETHRVHEAMHAMWPEWKTRYAAALAKHANVLIGDVWFNPEQEVRYRLDGKTPMIDLPEAVIAQKSPSGISLRNCAALCVHDFSSKIWTRINPVPPKELPVDSLPEVLDRYRSLANLCGEWFHSELKKISNDLLAGPRAANDGALEVTTVGLRVDDAGERGEDFDAWLFDSNGAPQIDKEDFQKFMTQGAVLDYDIREVAKHESVAFWTPMTTAVRLANGDLASRSAMYLVRLIGDDMTQAVGIAFDDSEAGDLASEVALKMSRVLANRL
ncbi:MAG TPA: hypothetical protein VGQ65_07440 [Thermoanaerobaculia bacterium]|nr:hypothetical protein [Thermoanaerobaculia bacterium]